jgi:hypothetical protein
MLLQTQDTFAKEEFTGTYVTALSGSSNSLSCNSLGTLAFENDHTFLSTTTLADCGGALTENIGVVGTYSIYDQWGWAEFHATFGTTSAYYYDAIFVSPTKFFLVNKDAGQVQFGIAEKSQ